MSFICLATAAVDPGHGPRATADGTLAEVEGSFVVFEMIAEEEVSTEGEEVTVLRRAA